jgi:hypothetical protein
MYTCNKPFQREVNLYYWKDKPDDQEGHWVAITNINKFFADVTKDRNAKHLCGRCLSHFADVQGLETHKIYCEHENWREVHFRMPPPGAVQKFMAYNALNKSPFVIYADSEALTCEVPLNDAALSRYTTKTQRHVACALGLWVVSTVQPPPPGIPTGYEEFAGPDCVKRFLARLIEIEKAAVDYIKTNVKMSISPEQQAEFDAAQRCYMCNGEFVPDKVQWSKVRDHDHMTGEYRGAAHSRCNLKVRKRYKVPVFFHNFRGYDSHLIVAALEHFLGREVHVIGQGLEKWLTMDWGDALVFKDSYQFAAQSLQYLVDSLNRSKGLAGFAHLRAGNRELSDEKLTLLTRKGVFPYDYVNSEERLRETELPPRTAFYNRLHAEECSLKDYAHARRVCSAV